MSSPKKTPTAGRECQSADIVGPARGLIASSIVVGGVAGVLVALALINKYMTGRVI